MFIRDSDSILLGGYYMVLEQRFQENTLMDCIRKALDEEENQQNKLQAEEAGNL